MEEEEEEKKEEIRKRRKRIGERNHERWPGLVRWRERCRESGVRKDGKEEIREKS